MFLNLFNVFLIDSVFVNVVIVNVKIVIVFIGKGLEIKLIIVVIKIVNKCYVLGLSLDGVGIN